MTAATYKRNSLIWLMISEGLSPGWKKKGTAGCSHLGPQLAGRESVCVYWIIHLFLRYLTYLMLMGKMFGYKSKQSRPNLCPCGSYCVAGKTRKTNIKFCGEKTTKNKIGKGLAILGWTVGSLRESDGELA